MKRRNQRKAAFERVAPLKFVLPSKPADPQKRSAIAAAIAQRKKRARTGTSNGTAVNGAAHDTVSQLVYHAMRANEEQQNRVKKQVHAARARVRLLHDERRHLMCMLVGLANGASRSELELFVKEHEQARTEAAVAAAAAAVAAAEAAAAAAAAEAAHAAAAAATSTGTGTAAATNEASAATGDSEDASPLKGSSSAGPTSSAADTVEDSDAPAGRAGGPSSGQSPSSDSNSSVARSSNTDADPEDP